MANIYWAEEKASAMEIQNHIMFEAEKTLGGKSTFGFCIQDGEAQLWIEHNDTDDKETGYWNILKNSPKIKGWRVLIFKCPAGYLECFEASKNIRTIRFANDKNNRDVVTG